MELSVGSALALVVTTGLLAGYLVLLEQLVRRHQLGGSSPTLAHVGSALLVTLSCLWLDHRGFVLLGIGFALVLAGLRLRRRPLRSLAVTAGSWGEVGYGLGVAAAALLAPGPAVFVAAVWVLGVAHPAARLVGTRIPRPVLPRGGSLAGSLAVVLLAVVLVPLAVPISLPAVLLVAVLAAAAELFGPRGWDNLLLPVVVALSLRLLG